MSNQPPTLQAKRVALQESLKASEVEVQGWGSSPQDTKFPNIGGDSKSAVGSPAPHPDPGTTPKRPSHTKVSLLSPSCIVYAISYDKIQQLAQGMCLVDDGLKENAMTLMLGKIGRFDPDQASGCCTCCNYSVEHHVA